MNYKEATLFSWAVMILIFALTSTTTTTIIKNLFLPPLLRPLNATGTFYGCIYIHIFFIRIPQRFSNFFFYLQNKWFHNEEFYIQPTHQLCGESKTWTKYINHNIPNNIIIKWFKFQMKYQFFLSLDIFSHKSLSVCHLLLFFSFRLVSLFMRSLSVTQST